MDIRNKYWKMITIFYLCLFFSNCGSSGGGSSSSSNNNIAPPPPQNITMDFKKSDTIIGVIDSSFHILMNLKILQENTEYL